MRLFRNLQSISSGFSFSLVLVRRKFMAIIEIIFKLPFDMQAAKWLLPLEANKQKSLLSFNNQNTKFPLISYLNDNKMYRELVASSYQTKINKKICKL